jgi:hypothetical protein
MGTSTMVLLIRVPDSYTVQPRSCTLNPLPTALLESGQVVRGVLHWIRVVFITRGQWKIHILLFYGRICNLTLDQVHITWHDFSGLLEYSTKKEQALLWSCRITEDLSQKKSHMILPPNFTFAWGDAWDSVWSRKEAMLFWQLWHKVVAVNAWH